MLAIQHWYYRYPRNLRAAYYVILTLSWVAVGLIAGLGKLEQLRAARRTAASEEVGIIMPADTIRYSEMAPPPSLSSDAIAAEAALPEAAAPAAIEDVTSSVPLPVPDEQAEVATMATQQAVGGIAAPAATGGVGAAVVLAETTKTLVADDNTPAPFPPKFMKATTMPKPVSDVKPEYPDAARRLNMEGTALVNMWLKKDGSVSRVMIYKSSNWPILDSAAARAAAKSTFTPALDAAGRPTNVWVQRPFKFTLSGGK